MRAKRRQGGVTLTEMTVVIAVIAVLAVFGIPAVRTLMRSFESVEGTRTMISAALASARAIAAKEQKYAGVRFQKAYSKDNPVKASQYMIFIVNDAENTGLPNGFRAVQGVKPIKLPDTIGVTDMTVRINDSEQRVSDGDWVSNENKTDTDVSTFSIVFSPTGKLVQHLVRARNRNGFTEWSESEPNDFSKDETFNTRQRVTRTKPEYRYGTFIQDDYKNDGLYEEHSRNSFVIYDRGEFESVSKDRRYRDYLSKQEVMYINPYTGTLIGK